MPFRFAVSFFLALLLHGAIGSETADAASQDLPQKMRIGIFPFSNYSNTENAEQFIMPVLRKSLEQQGFDLADEEAMNEFLLQERVRTTAYISSALARKIGEKLGIDAILLGAVFLYSDSEVPKVGLSARLVGTDRGELIWTQYSSGTGEDFTTLFGLGNITSVSKLAARVTDRVMAGLEGQEGFGRDTETAYRVAVLPFLNKSRNPEAGTVVTNLFLTRFFHSPRFMPLEFGDVRQTVVNRHIRAKGELSYTNIRAFAEEMHADVVLVGVVEHFDDGYATGSQPAVIITARLIDTRTRRILWSDDIQLKGDDRIVAFDFGKLRTVDRVAFSAVGDMIKKMEKLEWR